MRSIRRNLCGLALLTLLSATTLLAQESESKGASGLGFGLKAGFGLSPTQFVLGGQVSLGKSLGIFRVIPNAHVGIGDNTTFDVNVDFLARFIAQDSNFGFYGGASPTLVFGDNTNFGGNVVVGLQLPLIPNQATNLEARIGLGKVPDFRLLFAIIF
jgi:hypothetical protein